MSYYWTFGDAGNSTSPAPSHTYAANGVYVVNFKASNTCFSESKQDTVHVGPAGVGNIINNANGLHILYGTGGKVNVIYDGSVFTNFDVHATNGKKVYGSELRANQVITAYFSPGVYVYRAYCKTCNAKAVNGKLLVE